MWLFIVEASDPACWAVGPLESQGTYSTLRGCLKCRHSLQPAGRGSVPLTSSSDFFWIQTSVLIAPEFERGLKTWVCWIPSPPCPLGCWLDFFLKKREIWLCPLSKNVALKWTTAMHPTQRHVPGCRHPAQHKVPMAPGCLRSEEVVGKGFSGLHL